MARQQVSRGARGKLLGVAITSCLLPVGACGLDDVTGQAGANSTASSSSSSGVGSGSSSSSGGQSSGASTSSGGMADAAADASPSRPDTGPPPPPPMLEWECTDVDFDGPVVYATEGLCELGEDVACRAKAGDPCTVNNDLSNVCSCEKRGAIYRIKYTKACRCVRK